LMPFPVVPPNLLFNNKFFSGEMIFFEFYKRVKTASPA